LGHKFGIDAVAMSEIADAVGNWIQISSSLVTILTELSRNY